MNFQKPSKPSKSVCFSKAAKTQNEWKSQTREKRPENALNQIAELPLKHQENVLNPEISKQVETEMKTESTKIPGKKWEKRQNLGKVAFTAYFKKTQKRKNKKSESFPPISRNLGKINRVNFGRGNFPQFQTQIAQKPEKNRVRFTANFKKKKNG